MMRSHVYGPLTPGSTCDGRRRAHAKGGSGLLMTRRDQMWESRRGMLGRSQVARPPPKVVPVTGAAFSPFKVAPSEELGAMTPRAMAGALAEASASPSVPAAGNEHSAKDEALFEEMVRHEMMMLESQVKEKMLLGRDSPPHDVTRAQPRPAAYTDAPLEYDHHSHVDNAVSSSHLPYARQRDEGPAGTVINGHATYDGLWGGTQPSPSHNSYNQCGAEITGVLPGQGQVNGAVGRRRSSGFGRGLQSLWDAPNEYAKREMQEAYARSLAQQVSEKAALQRNEGLASVERQSTWEGTAASATGGLMVGGGSPNRLRNSPPRRRGPGLNQMWADPDDRRSKTLDRQEYARMLDQQLAEKREKHDNDLAHRSSETQMYAQQRSGRRLSSPPQQHACFDLSPSRVQAPECPSGRRSLEQTLSEAEKKTAYAAALRQQIMDNEERRRREKEERRLSEMAGGAHAPVGPQHQHPQQQQLQHQHTSPQHDMVQGPLGPRRRGGGGEPTFVSNDLRQRHSMLNDGPAPAHQAPSPTYGHSPAPPAHPSPASVCSPLYAEPVGFPKASPPAMSESRRRLVREVYCSDSPWGSPTVPAPKGSSAQLPYPPTPSSGTDYAPPPLQGRDVPPAESPASRPPPMPPAGEHQPHVSPVNRRASFAKHGALAYDPNAQETLRLKQQQALEQRILLEQQMEEKRRAKEADVARRKAEEKAELLALEEERCRMERQQRHEKEEREAKQRAVEEANRREQAATAAAATTAAFAAAAAAAKAEETAGDAYQRPGPSARRRTEPQPSAELPTPRADRSSGRPSSGDGSMSTRRPHSGGGGSVRSPAGVRRQQGHDMWETLTGRDGGSGRPPSGRDGNEGDAGSARRERRGYEASPRQAMDKGHQGPRDDPLDLEKSLATESKFIALDEDATVTRSSAREPRGSRPDQDRPGRNGDSTYRPRNRHAQGHDEMDAFVDNWQNRGGRNALPAQRVAGAGRRLSEPNARPSLQDQALGAWEGSLAAESTFMELNDDERRAEDEWLKSLGGGALRAGNSGNAPSPQQRMKSKAPTPPLSPLTQLLRNHKEIQPDRDVLEDMCRAKTNRRSSTLLDEASIGASDGDVLIGTREDLCVPRDSYGVGVTSDAGDEAYAPESFENEDDEQSPVAANSSVAQPSATPVGRPSSTASTERAKLTQRWKTPTTEDERRRMLEDMR